MKTQAAILLLGAALMLVVCVVHSSGGVQRPVRWITFALLAFVSMQGVLFVVLELGGGRRDTSFGRVVAGADPLPGRPSLVLLGSSYTARNIDGQLLRQVLARGGVDIQVLQLSLPGGFAYEQDYHLSRLLRGPLRNTIVLAELGTERAWTVARDNLYKHDTIGHHDAVRVRDKVAIALSDDEVDAEGLIDVLKLGLAHHVNLGLAHAMVSGARQLELAGFVPQPKLSAAVPLDRILAGLSAADADVPVAEAFPAYARRRADAWRSLGADRVLFFQPPNADPAARGWTGRFCSALQGSCVPFDGTRHMAGDFWNNEGHLNLQGARRFTEWLGQRLLERKDFFSVI